MKIYELNLDYLKNICEEEKYSFDYLFDNNVDLINNIDFIYYYRNKKYIYFKYKYKYFKASRISDEDFYSCEDKCYHCLGEKCSDLFPFCITEILYGEKDMLSLKEIEEYEIVFGGNNYEEKI